MSTTLEQDLRGVAARHLDRATPAQLLQLIEQLVETPSRIVAPEISLDAHAAKPARFLRLWPDAQDGEHVAVHDHQTGLEWSAGIIGESSWTDAQKLAAGCTLLGKRDWRLPTVQELLTLVDYERCDPAVDPAFFRGPFGWTWSGTPAAGASGCAWSVSLVDGFSSRDYRSSHDHVRAVRAGQALALGL